jgi:carbamoyl-phosphate synthase large subunit
MTLRMAVTGISGDVGRGAYEGLRRNPRDAEPIWLLGLDAGGRPDGLPLMDGFVQLPTVADPGYLEALLAALQSHQIEVLLPGIDSEIRLLSRARDRLAEIRAKVVLAPSELVEAADDKLLTAGFLASRGIGAPETRDTESPIDFDFPIVAKPRRGHGSQGVVTLDNKEALCHFLSAHPRDYCLQRFIQGPEFTIGFLYSSEGVMNDAIAMERTLENGRTICAKVVDGPEMMKFVEEFGQKISGVGAINAQLRWDGQRGPMVFELNARLSGSTEMRVAVGFNDPLRLAQHFGRGTPIDPARPRKAIVRRSGQELRVDQS